MNLPNSQTPTPEILATPFLEEDTLNPTHSPTVDNQINSFVSSDTEPQDPGFSDTFNLIESAYSNVKHKKIKYILLKDIKTKTSIFIQYKTNEKLNSHNQNQHETLRQLETEIEFLKNEIISKNEITTNLFKYDTQKDNNIDRERQSSSEFS